MAIKVKRKTAAEKKEEIQDDQIYTFNQTVFNYIEKNKVAFATGLGALLVTIVVLTALGGSAKRRTVETGSEVFAVAQIATAPLAEEVEGIEINRPVFDDAQSRREAAAAAVATLENDAPAVQLLQGAVQADSDASAARATFSELAGEDLPTSMAPVVALSSASLEAATGSLDAARAQLDSIRSAMPELGPAVQLELARQTEAAGDLAAAQTLYAELADADPPETPSMTQLQVTRTARFRANLLSVALGQPAPAPSDSDSE